MKNRRLTSIIILTVASVFLFFCLSCGIPRYIVPKVTFSGVTPGDKTDSFRITYSCEDVVGDDGRIGLLLLYTVEGSTPTKDTNITGKFKNTFIPSSYNGANVQVDLNTPVMTVTSSKEEVDVYAFTSNESLISDPLYTLSLPVGGDFSKKIDLVYDSTNNVINLYVDGAQFESAVLGLDPSSVLNNYIAVYAAVSVKSTSFTNHYWSDLNFVGSIKVN